MSLLASYLSSRRTKNVLNLMEKHVGRCKAVGHTLGKIATEWSQGETEKVKINKEVIHTEEKSADNLEKELIKEVTKSEFSNDKLKEDLIKFVRMVDTSAGGAKRAATNMLLLVDYPLPDKYAKILDDAAHVIAEIFVEIEKAINNIKDVEFIKQSTLVIDKLEDDMDDYYSQLKKGYFEIEQSFGSAAALIILDHVARDLEHCADMGEDASEILLELVQRRA